MEEVEEMTECRVLPLSLVAAVTLVLAAATAVQAQEPSVRVYADPPEVAVGESFRVVVEVSGVRRIESIATPEPFDFARYRSRPVLSVKVPGGEAAGTANSVLLTYVFDAREAGLFEVGPFRIIADGRTLETEPLAILVAREGNTEVEVRARITPSRVHVGDDFMLTAEIVGGPMTNHEFIPPDLFGIVERLSPAGSLSRTEWSWSARAAEEGEFIIPPVKVVDGDRTYESQPLTLVVGAPRVRVEASLGSQSIWVGGEFDFSLTVRGVGTLDEEPATPLPNDVAELLDVRESSFDLNGGQVGRGYSFRALRAGRFEIGPMRIAANGQTFETQPVSLVVDEVPTGDADPPGDLLFTGVPGQSFAYVNEPVVVEYAVLHGQRRDMGAWPVIGTKSWPAFEGFDVLEVRGWGG
ncbi:MAG: protein BatD, partial [Gemmatimonadetes bacterium]|nr:protein BatD [Gemmatimonadota bacterium]